MTFTPFKQAVFSRHHAVWLGLWTVLGAMLRFTNLSEKAVWTDEFATFVFSLGRSFRTVPIDQVISLTDILKPVRLLPPTGVEAVAHHLLSESNHPPLYFVLTHLWLHLFPGAGPWVSVYAARSLAALFGIALIPALFGLGWLAFRSWRVAHLAALLMAFSPFAIYLSQEARHYTLPMLWIVAALACLLEAARSLNAERPLSVRLVLVWTVIHALGIATHYFFTLAIGAEAIALGFLLWQWRDRGHRYLWKNLRRLGWVALGTIASGLVWLPFFQDSQSSELTQWIYAGDRQGADWLAPLGQLLAGLITQLYLLPIQSDRLPIVLASGVALLVLTLITMPLLWRGWRPWRIDPDTQLALTTLTAFVVGAIALFLAITYGAGMDLTSAFRYGFVYFPAVIILVAAGLAGLWSSDSSNDASRLAFAQRFTTLVLVFCLLGGMTVVSNLGYQKTHRPDRVAQDIWTLAQQDPQTPSLIAIAHRSHGQTGRLMAIAWEWQRLAAKASVSPPEFLLAHQPQAPKIAVNTLEQILAKQPTPVYLWLINVQQLPQKPLSAVLEHYCRPKTDEKSVDGYEYQAYQCFSRSKL